MTWRDARHLTLLHDSRAAFSSGALREGLLGRKPNCVILRPRPNHEACYESPIIRAALPFNELLLSWNMDVPPGAWAILEVSVGRQGEKRSSPWLRVGDWGATPGKPAPTPRFNQGRVDVDIFRSNQHFDAFRYRLRAVATGPATCEVRVRRVAACYSDTLGQPSSAQPPHAGHRRRSGGRSHVRRLPVPFRSQRAVRRTLADRLCSPTSLAMVLEFHGVKCATLDLARLCHDPVHDIYGNWVRNVQAAASLGIDGYLTRFSAWGPVERLIANGLPVIASIRFNRPRLIRAAPYRMTQGHLLVICGFDASGNVEVCDPAVADPAHGARLSYPRAELEQAWFGGSGGVAYVLMPRPRPEKRGRRRISAKQ